MAAPATILIMTAMPVELARVRVPEHVVAATYGVGQNCARRRSGELLDQHRPARAVVLGFSGALTPGWAIGQVATPGHVLTSDPGKLPLALDAAGSTLRLVTVDQVVHSVEAKRQLGVRTGAELVDMETYAVAEQCHARGIPLTVARAVTDPLDAPLPLWMTECVNAGGRVRPAATARLLLMNPGRLVTMLKLGRAARMGAMALARWTEQWLAAMATARKWS